MSSPPTAATCERHCKTVAGAGPRSMSGLNGATAPTETESTTSTPAGATRCAVRSSAVLEDRACRLPDQARILTHRIMAVPRRAWQSAMQATV